MKVLVISPASSGNSAFIFTMQNNSKERCGSNAFQDYIDDAKESSVKQVSRIKIQDSRIIKIKIQVKNQDSRFKNQEKTQSR